MYAALSGATRRGNRLRWGLFHQVWASSAVSDAACIADAIDDVILADELGFSSCWFGEHHGNRHKPVFGRIPAPEILISHLIPQTSRIHLGTGVKILPGDSVTRTAEAMTLLDLIGESRVEFGLGMSMRTDKLAVTHDRGEDFRWRLESVLNLLSVSAEGSTEAMITPRPTRDFRPSIWVAARELATVTHAANLGVHLVVGQLEEAEKQRGYVDAFRRMLQGAVTYKQHVRGVRMVHAAESDNEAWRCVGTTVRRMFNERATAGYGRVAAAEGRLKLEDSDDPAEMMRQVGFVAGSPDTVYQQLARYLGASGVDQLDVQMHLPGIDSEAARRSMRLYATEVAPRLANRFHLLGTS